MCLHLKVLVWFTNALLTLLPVLQSDLRANKRRTNPSGAVVPNWKYHHIFDKCGKIQSFITFVAFFVPTYTQWWCQLRRSLSGRSPGPRDSTGRRSWIAVLQPIVELRQRAESVCCLPRGTVLVWKPDWRGGESTACQLVKIDLQSQFLKRKF